MTTDRLAVAGPRLWLLIAAVLAAISVAVLWPLQHVGQVCILIYPAPPGCGAEEPRWVPFVAIGLIVAALAAAVVVYFTVPAPRTILVILCGAMLVIVLVAVAVVQLSQTASGIRISRRSSSTEARRPYTRERRYCGTRSRALARTLLTTTTATTSARAAASDAHTNQAPSSQVARSAMNESNGVVIRVITRTQAMAASA